MIVLNDIFRLLNTQNLYTTPYDLPNLPNPSPLLSPEQTKERFALHKMWEGLPFPHSPGSIYRPMSNIYHNKLVLAIDWESFYYFPLLSMPSLTQTVVPMASTSSIMSGLTTFPGVDSTNHDLVLTPVVVSLNQGKMQFFFPFLLTCFDGILMVYFTLFRSIIARSGLS
jgi:hypothetical protein